jgi:hypothetical protein
MLDDAQRQLEARFTELAAMRKPLDYPVYALEHGLEPYQMEAIAKSASLELRQSGLRKAHWLVWTALAAEAGYRYAGEEYWPALELARGEWRSNDFRDLLRTWFRSCHVICRIISRGTSTICATSLPIAPRPTRLTLARFCSIDMTAVRRASPIFSSRPS